MANVSVVPWKICNGAFSYNGGVGKHAFCAGSLEGGVDSCQVSNKSVEIELFKNIKHQAKWKIPICVSLG